MRLMLAILPLASIVAGCAGSIPSDSGKAIEGAQRQERALNADLLAAVPPAELRRPCAGPVALRAAIRAGRASAGETERLWRADRRELVSCARRKQAVQEFYRRRDEGIAGKAEGGKTEPGKGGRAKAGV